MDASSAVNTTGKLLNIEFNRFIVISFLLGFLLKILCVWAGRLVEGDVSGGLLCPGFYHVLDGYLGGSGFHGVAVDVVTDDVEVSVIHRFAIIVILLEVYSIRDIIELERNVG
jgi:hypothetical protein